MTLEGVARALGRKLELNPEALGMIRQRYEGLVREGILKEFELTPARLKMATFPQGAVPLRNSAGTAPGVLLWEGRSNIVCLPGVPKEMKAIFEESLKPILEKRIIRLFPFGATLFVKGIVESSLSPLLDRVLEAHPGVYVKSHPKGVEDGVSKIEVHIVSHARGQAEAKSKTMAAARTLAPLIEQKSGLVERVEEEPIGESVPGEGP
jgi:molybdopterin-biosynthesis enzyme MoeA-like protein